jgi:hypothetical protein
VAREPVEACLGTAGDIFMMGEILLEQLEACCVVDGSAG